MYAPAPPQKKNTRRTARRARATIAAAAVRGARAVRMGWSSDGAEQGVVSYVLESS